LPNLQAEMRGYMVEVIDSTNVTPSAEVNGTR